MPLLKALQLIWRYPHSRGNVVDLCSGAIIPLTVFSPKAGTDALAAEQVALGTLLVRMSQGSPLATTATLVHTPNITYC